MKNPIEDEATWRKANPALGDFLNIDEIRGLAAKAGRMPSFESSFRNLHLNQRVSTFNQLFARSVWEENAGEPDMSVFERSQSTAALICQHQAGLNGAGVGCSSALASGTYGAISGRRRLPSGIVQRATRHHTMSGSSRA